EEEKALTAYHEAGHAIVGLNVPHHDPIHKATIIPRGRALGMVLSLPEKDHYTRPRVWFTSRIAMGMGGKAAEVLKFGEENVAAGAATDIKHVPELARSMVTQFGMSQKLGNIDYANENQSYLGTWQGGSSHAGSTQQIIDEEVRRLVDEGYEDAKRILTEHR